VLRSGTPEVPRLERGIALEPHLELVRELFADCRGNLVRVHEELHRKGVDVGYPTLTAFCRRVGLGRSPKEPAGRYHFDPGEEMQHDTSPHTVEVGGRRRLLHCASLVLCYSRMLYAQCYSRFNRFWCKVFLTEALSYFGGAATRAMIDNTSVIIAHGSGRDAVPAPEMAAFAERFGFAFRAHEVGDADRSGRVERPFHYIENNFYPGRRFETHIDLNTQLRAWCDSKNGSYKRHLRARPIELFATERPILRPLPIFVPEVYEQVVRIVDVEGYVHLHTNRYSVPPAGPNSRSYLHRPLRVRGGKDRVRIFDGHSLLCEHVRREDGAGTRSTLPEHTLARRRADSGSRQLADEKLLRAASPVLGRFVDALKTRRDGGRLGMRLRQLRRLYLEYPTEALVAALEVALPHGLFDLRRIEELVLKHVGKTFFQLPRGGTSRGAVRDDDYDDDPVDDGEDEDG
jgi:transposase